MPCLCLLVLAVAGCSPDGYPQTALRPLSDFARIGDHVQDQTFYWALGVFVLVEGALLYAIFRFRGRPDDPEPRQIHGNTMVEIIWTVIPALILAAIAVPTVKGIFEVNGTPQGNLLEVEVVGHQWWWEFRYPQYGIVTANELVIPAGRTVHFKENSVDVVHSWWPPRFAGKRDVFPGRETRIWFKADSTGLYPGQCAEFCGIQHARMAFHVRSETPEAFEAWAAHMQTLGAPKPAAAAGTRRHRLAPHGQLRRQRRSRSRRPTRCSPRARHSSGTRAVSGAIRFRPRARRRRSSARTWRTSGRGPTSPRDGSRTRTRTWRRGSRTPRRSRRAC